MSLCRSAFRRLVISPRSRHLVALAGVTVSLLLPCRETAAQGIRTKQHPLTAYLDLRTAAPGSPAQSAPSWVEAFEFVPAVPNIRGLAGSLSDEEIASSNQGIDPFKSFFRVRLERPPQASEHLQIRVLFDDLATGPRPKIAVWNEIGEKQMPATPIGQGLGISSSETLNLSMDGVNYLEIEAPGDGTQIRALFMTWLQPALVLQPGDFTASERERQPFGIEPALRTHRTDTFYHGVVTAKLQGNTPVVLKPVSAPSVSYEFELEHPPLVAVVSYEVLGAALDAVPALVVNGRSLGSCELHLPDLADPAFRGESREKTSGMSFRYAGWIRAQKVIPGVWLAAGLNSLSLSLSNEIDAAAIRSVSIQLKYNWDKLDYDLTPAPATDATP